MTDDRLRAILTEVKSIAMVGASDNADRPAHRMLLYLLRRGYRVFPVNPKLAGGTLAGVPAYARLADVPERIDMVDVFRLGAALPGLVDEILALHPRPAVLWTQLDVRHAEAEAMARTAGLQVVVNRCPKIEIQRLFGRW